MDKVYVDHGDRIFAAGEGTPTSVILRLFTPAGYNTFDLQVEEMAPLIELLQVAVARDAENRLENKEPVKGIGR